MLCLFTRIVHAVTVSELLHFKFEANPNSPFLIFFPVCLPGFFLQPWSSVTSSNRSQCSLLRMMIFLGIYGAFFNMKNQDYLYSRKILLYYTSKLFSLCSILFSFTHISCFCIFFAFQRYNTKVYLSNFNK